MVDGGLAVGWWFGGLFAASLCGLAIGALVYPPSHNGSPWGSLLSCVLLGPMVFLTLFMLLMAVKEST